MVSDANKKKAAQKKVVGLAKRGGTATTAVSSKAATSENKNSLASGVADLLISDRTCTGNLVLHPQSRDIRVSALCDQYLQPCLGAHAQKIILFKRRLFPVWMKKKGRHPTGPATPHLRREAARGLEQMTLSLNTYTHHQDHGSVPEGGESKIGNTDCRK